MISAQSLYPLLANVKLADKARLKKRIQGVSKIQTPEKQQKALATIENAINKSIENKALKIASLPKVTYAEGLPVSEHVDQIGQAILENQVVIIAGETGSGKTTQIPKICLELGRGIDGMIGHTQPRRIAARTVANRIADELNSPLGETVGYKVRFNDQVSDVSFIKLMTDGILLAEMQKDRLLRQYDTIIIDEAHERSLNIDFILGYLKQVLVKRSDLKVIITSATIDPERFSKHFNNAPIIEVSGRTYPVEMRYRALNEEDENQDIISGIIGAVEELSTISQGDILIFLNGEREIRDTAAALEKENLRNTNVLPLYARLTVQEQNRIFQSHSGRNIVLATNVAETSLTVPGIKYVIDPGTARISRYSYRTKVQRLPIEPISQASANQRAGRCGRVSAGVCIRLYSEDDFLSRPEFTDPEILRTNLATVILQMLSLDLGDIADFPFVQAPDNRNINDGVRLLEELAAIKKVGQSSKLTPVGRQLSRFPIDPRLSKMVLAASDLGCLQQVCAIVSALSIQDPRERPHEKQQAADEKHNRFKDKQSDFVSLLNLWHYVTQQQKTLSQNQFRKLCQKEYLSYIRIREWQDIYSQLKQTLREMDISMSTLDVEFTPQYTDNDSKQEKAKRENSLNIIHQALLSGLLSHLGQLDENREFKGARGSKFFIFPGSGVAKKPPKWIMAAELVETSRLFARMVAKIDPLWIEPLAGHLMKKSYSEPHWEKKQGAVMAYEQISLYGMVIVPKRKINFNKIEPKTCQELFIREALVNGDVNLNEAFYTYNLKLIDEVELLEKKARRKGILADEEILFEFYKERLPEQVICLRSFLSWWKKEKQKQPKLLNFTKAFLLQDNTNKVTKQLYPETWQQDNITLPLSYHFSPGDEDDGISVHIPIGILNQVQDIGFDWLIPALREELIISYIKGLPKASRRNFVPAPNYAQASLANMQPFDGRLSDSLAKQLLRMTGVRLHEDVWKDLSLPAHLVMNFKALDNKGNVIGQSRDLSSLQENLQGKVKATIQKVAEKGIEQKQLTTWSFGQLPKSYEKKMANITIKAFPAIVDHQKDVAIELFEHQAQAELANLKGISRLVLLNIPSPVKYLQEKLPNKAKLGLYFNPFGSIADLLEDCIVAASQYLIKNGAALPSSEQEFIACKDRVRAELADCVLDAAVKVERVLSLSHEIRKKLKGAVSLTMIQGQGDIKAQIEQLVFKGFVTASGVDKLDHIVRYLNGVLKRLEKLPIDPNQDRLKMIEVEKVTKLLDSEISKQRKDQPIPQYLTDCRWMIEELRVSLFAQNLGTAQPISVKRIENFIKEHQE
ncbi:ATP-dependent RNA helicase HrpA [Thalassotalea atypica]|uniref:ATP-dependent RNA helicase HrpA n=1 Tax=Thalassotalea atypica TaxID=2054316 RepID=UPI002573971A|nr:ATP-dependent RNA helicase HrpA [Thalassotalea atypica]